MRHFGWAVGMVSLGLLAGCVSTPAAPPGGGGGPLATAAPPSPTPAPPAQYRQNFDQMPLGALAADAPFVDVRDELVAKGQPVPTWLYSGGWEITDVDTAQLKSRVLKQAKVQERPPIALLRYRGTFAGQEDGVMPAKYRMEVTQQPIRSPYNLPPTGDQGVQPYYLDANHYVEVVTTPNQLQLWVCDGGVPDSSAGWTKLWEQNLGTRPGDIRRVGAIVDVKARKFTLLYDGERKAEAVVDLIDPSRPHYVALRAIGNEVNFDDFELERLP